MASKIINRGAWTAEEDRCLAEVIQLHGPQKWKTIATKAGLDRCGKSCRLRWLNYLRPNIKKGNITDQEEGLIIRLHNLLGNRWSLIAGRLPGRTDNEIKNYWNSHLSKKLNKEEEKNEGTKVKRPRTEEKGDEDKHDFTNGIKDRIVNSNNDDDNFFDFSNESPVTLEWINKFLELDNNSKDQPS